LELRKLFERESLDFLQKNAENSLKNLKQFSFSDLEIVSKSAQKVCAKLAEKMRSQIQDEELGDVVVNVRGQLESDDYSFRSHMDLLTFFQQGLGKYKDEPWLQEKDMLNKDIGKDITKAKTEVQKGLFEVLFPQGHKLRDIELRGETFFQRSKLNKIWEVSTIVKTTVY
jgi:hypothetical protein